VSQHNYFVHVYNLKRLYWVNYFVPIGETALARANHIAMRDSAGARILEFRTAWVTRLTSIMRDLQTKMDSIPIGRYRGKAEYARKEAYRAKLGQEIDEARKYRPLSTHPVNNQLIPDARLYYREISDEARGDFWSDK